METQVLGQRLPLACYVTLGESLALYGPQCPLLAMRWSGSLGTGYSQVPALKELHFNRGDSQEKGKQRNQQGNFR